MNILRSSLPRLRGISHFTSLPSGNLSVTGTSYLRSFSNWMTLGVTSGPKVCRCGPLSSQAEGSGVFQQLSWQYQQVRTKKRGTEYQPKNIKRKRTHGWIKRLSSRGGIEVLLRRMFKGRKSLSHWKTLLENSKTFKQKVVSNCWLGYTYWVAGDTWWCFCLAAPMWWYIEDENLPPTDQLLNRTPPLSPGSFWFIMFGWDMCAIKVCHLKVWLWLCWQIN